MSGISSLKNVVRGSFLIPIALNGEGGIGTLVDGPASGVSSSSIFVLVSGGDLGIPPVRLVGVPSLFFPSPDIFFNLL